jgi:uncharacterized protein (DUF849 family)
MAVIVPDAAGPARGNFRGRLTRVITRMKVCLNGDRPPGAHPALPLSPAQLADAAVASVAAGAEAVHLHARGPDGRESLAAADVGAAVAAVRAACPGVPVGVSTGLWITGGDAALRRAQVAEWVVRPDFASVNVGEDGYADLVALLHERGVAVEAGVWSPADAARAGRVERILVEIIGTPAGQAVERAAEILAVPGDDVPILLHGEGDACWPLVAEAGRRRLPTRIGLEDTLTLPDGAPAADNADLVRAALAVWTAQVQ